MGVLRKRAVVRKGGYVFYNSLRAFYSAMDKAGIRPRAFSHYPLTIHQKPNKKGAAPTMQPLEKIGSGAWI